MTTLEPVKVVKLEHHVQQELCQTRPLYRQGKKLTAVKVATVIYQVYTVNNESQHLIICGVPKINLKDEVQRIVSPYGIVKIIEDIPDYPAEEFTETFHVRYERIQSARIAKRFLDTKNFFGGILHVFYAPELETVVETRKKLIQRRKDVAVRIKRHQEDATNLETNQFEPRAQYHRSKKYPTLPLTEDRLSQQYPGESFSSINNGIPVQIDPRPVSEPSLPGCSGTCTFPDATKKPREEENKKNYKGRNFHSKPVIKVVRPKLIDTNKIAQLKPENEEIVEKKKDPIIFQARKKLENKVKIKLISNLNDTKKRIVIKNPSATRLIEPSSDLQSSIKSVKSSIREAMQKNE